MLLISIIKVNTIKGEGLVEMLTDQEIKKIIEKIGEMGKKNASMCKTKRIICSVDLGIVVLEVTMGLN